MSIRLIFPFLIGLCFSIFLLNVALKSIESQKLAAENFALGAENTPFYAEDGDINFHCGDFRYYPLSNCFEDYKNMVHPKPITLYMGNSQLHGVNQVTKFGYNSSSKILYEYLKTKDEHLMTLSMPNISLQEQFATFEYVNSQIEKVKNIIIAVSFDNTRETGLRKGLKKMFNDKALVQGLSESSFGKGLLVKYNTEENQNSGDMNALEDTFQKVVEKDLNSKFGHFWRTWSMRGVLRTFSLIRVYKFRNNILGLNSSSERSKIPSRYKENFDALNELLLRAKSKNINVILYAVPLRPVSKIPYHKEEYSQFKKDLKAISDKHQVSFYNLEDLVPINFWGTYDGNVHSSVKKGEVDFMHFQAGGHELLGARLIEIISQSPFN